MNSWVQAISMMNSVKKVSASAEYRHRLGVFLNDEQNRHTNPITFLDDQNNLIYQQPAAYNGQVFSPRKDSLGKAYISNGKKINAPMNFSAKNRISLSDLHNILKEVIFPGAVSGRKLFNLNADDQNFLYQYLSQYPGENLFPAWSKKEFPDNYAKFLVPVSTGDSIPKNIRVFDKSGNAYGQMLDLAYIADFDNNVEFFLSAVIYANNDGVLNDDNYDYETLSKPFLKNLAAIFYNYELRRKKAHLPDLEKFRLIYDK